MDARRQFSRDTLCPGFRNVVFGLGGEAKAGALAVQLRSAPEGLVCDEAAAAARHGAERKFFLWMEALKSRSFQRENCLRHDIVRREVT